MRTVAAVIVLFGSTGCGGGTSAAQDAGVKPKDAAVDARPTPLDGPMPDAQATGSFSCDAMLAGYHICFEETWTGSESFGASVKQGCMGELVSSCTHDGSNGGCEYDMSFPGGMVHAIAWYYDITAALIMQTCGQVKGAYVAP